MRLCAASRPTPRRGRPPAGGWAWALAVLLALGLPPAWGQSRLDFSELYSRITVRGVEFSPKLLALNGREVAMEGWMAPPLKPKLDFFVLTKAPMATCPFCSTAADWPPDIVLVIMPKGQEAEPTPGRIRVVGRLEVGAKVDPETGFLSLVRIYARRVEEAR